MSTVEEIEAAIQNLPPDDYTRVRNWLTQYDNALWDKQIEMDSSSGKLDHLIDEIESDLVAGRVKPLNEVIHDS